MRKFVIIVGVCKWLAVETQVIRMSGVTTVTEATKPYIQPEAQRLKTVAVRPEEVRLMTGVQESAGRRTTEMRGRPEIPGAGLMTVPEAGLMVTAPEGNHMVMLPGKPVCTVPEAAVVPIITAEGKTLCSSRGVRKLPMPEIIRQFRPLIRRIRYAGNRKEKENRRQGRNVWRQSAAGTLPFATSAGLRK